MRNTARRAVAGLRTLAALTFAVGLALAGFVPAAIARDGGASAAPSSPVADGASSAGVNPQSEDSSADGTSGRGSLSMPGGQDLQSNMASQSVGTDRMESAVFDDDDFSFRSVPLLAVQRMRSTAEGVVALSSNGELYTFNPTSRKVTPLPPYLPGLQNANGPYSSGTKRELRFAAASLQCRSNRPSRTEGKECYFTKGVNYNALGVGPDGTRYATLKIGDRGTPNEGKSGVSKAPVFQVYRFQPGDSQWQKFGPEFELPAELRSVSGNKESDLVFNGGQVTPDGTYYLSVTLLEGTGNQKRLVAHVYKTQGYGEPTKVGVVHDSSFVSGASGNDGDMLFTKSGDLVMGFVKYKPDLRPNRITGYNEINLELVSRGDLERSSGDRLNSSHLATVKVRDGYSIGEQNSAAGPANGLSINSDGTLITTHFSQFDSGSHFYLDNKDGISQFLMSMPSKPGDLGTFPNQNALPEWAYPLGAWQQVRDHFGGSSWQPKPWVAQLTDLAGEAFFPSVSVRKEVNGRADSRDEFTVTVDTGNTSKSASTSNSGNRNSAVTERIPVLSGTKVEISEQIDRRGANLSGYDVTLKCSGGLQAENLRVQSNRATASVTIEGAADDVECVFRNTAKVDGQMEWAKEDENGKLLPGSTWTLSRQDGTAFVIDGAPAAYPQFEVSDETMRGGLDQDPVAGKLLVTGLAPGKYLLTEKTAPDGYLKSTATYNFDITSPSRQPGQVHLKDGYVPQVGKFGTHNAVINERATGELTLEKRAKQSEMPTGFEPLLGGSEWKISREDGKPFTLGTGSARKSWTIADCIGLHNSACQGTSLDTDSRAGEIRVAGLQFGTYVLEETKAPQGYLRAKQPWTFTLDSTHRNHAFTGTQSIYNTELTGPAIPLSGGIGREFYVCIGAGILGFAAVTTLAMRRRHN